MKNIAIVGCGGMGSGHAFAISSGSGNAVGTFSEDRSGGFLHPTDTDLRGVLNLVGVCDINPARVQWAREHGFYVYPDFETVLQAPEVDIVLIATPNDMHKDMAIAAMRAGKHVLCEKPVMMCSKDLEEVMSVAKETGMVFYPRQNRRWDEDYLTVKKIYEEQLLGRVFHIESRVHGSRGIPGDWRGRKSQGGGMMLDWGVHLIDRIIDMIPEKVVNLYCRTTHITNQEVDDGFTLFLTFESGLTATVEVGTNNFIDLPLWYVTATDGTAEIDNWDLDGKMVRRIPGDEKDSIPILAGSGLTKTMAPRRKDTVETLPLPKVEFDANRLYVNLVETVEGTAEQIVKPEQALRILRLMEAALYSAETGTNVEFEKTSDTKSKS